MIKTVLLRARTLSVLFVTAIVATLMFASPAAAGNCTTIGGRTHCGDVYHRTDSDLALLRVTCTWDNRATSYQNVGRGADATCRDSDGYYIPSGCREWATNLVGPYWRKIVDTTNESVKIDC